MDNTMQGDGHRAFERVVLIIELKSIANTVTCVLAFTRDDPFLRYCSRCLNARTLQDGCIIKLGYGGGRKPDTCCQNNACNDQRTKGPNVHTRLTFLGNSRQGFDGGFSLAAVDAFPCRFNTLRQVIGLACDNERRGRVEQDCIAIGVLCPCEQRK